ncbi:MAG: hypothetical protein HY684_06050 [Chloroflexi bacterium]|nr:hypothetical protein [Chloroflexota bacterium]
MPARFSVYRWFKGSPTGIARLGIVDFILFWIGMGGFYLLDVAMTGLPTLLFDIWAGFVTGMTMLVIFNVLVELLGVGYAEWREAREDGHTPRSE